MEGFRYLDDATTLVVMTEGCIGCGRCEEVCPHGVFEVRERRVRVVDRDACIECGACMKNCPVEVITVDAGVGCATGMITEWLRDRGITRGGGGCCS